MGNVAPHRTATDLRILMAILDNARALAEVEGVVTLQLCREKAVTFAGACEEAATLLCPFFDEDLDEEEQPERWRQALEHIEWASRGTVADLPGWRNSVGVVARRALGKEP